ncbi:MAG: tyrosine-type recombinase/integrase [Alphaproteobacteria bacterium]|nr:tyrosine-type recombinase/integrase [Alphaproteobacteria bacterium]
MKLTKRNLDGLDVIDKRYFVWDDFLQGFGVRVEPSGRKTFLCRYRNLGVRRQYTLGRYGIVTPDQARTEAKRILGAVSLGDDPAHNREELKKAVCFSELFEVYLAGHGPKLKSRTRQDYISGITRHVLPAIGKLKAANVTVKNVNMIHVRLADHPHRANRIIAYMSSIFSWAAENDYVKKGVNPASAIKRFRENGRERYLSQDEINRLGAVLIQAETDGLPWVVMAKGERAKHVPKGGRNTVYPLHITNAIRLLLLTGCRLREILHLRWSEVDVERGLLLLPDSKTGRKTVILNRASIAILSSAERIGNFVVPSSDLNRPRHDLKRPWDHIRATAKLDDVRLHDLRHTHASIGAGAGFGLPVVGRLLGHKSSTTTQRYAHIADDPAHRASEAIGLHLDAALNQMRPDRL